MPRVAMATVKAFRRRPEVGRCAAAWRRGVAALWLVALSRCCCRLAPPGPGCCGAPLLPTPVLCGPPPCEPGKVSEAYAQPMWLSSTGLGPCGALCHAVPPGPHRPAVLLSLFPVLPHAYVCGSGRSADGGTLFRTWLVTLLLCSFLKELIINSSACCSGSFQPCSVLR